MIVYRKAVLIIHGFVGTTKDEESLFFYLNHYKRYDVYNFVLPGHDYTTNNIHYEEWLQSGKDHLEKLISYGYRNIYVVGHSMGGIIATYLAIHYPKYIKKLVLLAPAFDYLSYGDENFLSLIKGSVKLVKDYKFKGVFERAIKATPKMLSEFMKFVAKYQNIPSNVKCPTLIMHGNDDSVVPIESSYDVYDKINSKHKYIFELNKVNHDIFNSDKTDLVNLKIRLFLRNKRFQKNKKIKL